MYDKDENEESCLDIAHRLGRKVIADYLTVNYPELEGKVRKVEVYTREHY